jgi:hypothetical protein
VLSAAEPEYFALRGEAGGEKEEYCLPAGPWWGLARSITTYDASYYDSAASEGAFGRRVARACADKRFFVTDKGSMGLAPTGAREGDALAFFPTGKDFCMTGGAICCLFLNIATRGWGIRIC